MAKNTDDAAKAHAQTLLDIAKAGVTLTGVRLVRKDQPDEGIVVALTKDEAKGVADAVLAVLKKRAA